MNIRNNFPYLVIALGMILGVTCIVLSFVTFPGCVETRGYVETLTAWNDMMESYETQYQLADAATQAEWKAEIDPKITKANDALNVWGAAVGMANEEEKKEAYLALEREVIRLILQYGITIEGQPALFKNYVFNGVNTEGHHEINTDDGDDYPGSH